MAATMLLLSAVLLSVAAEEGAPEEVAPEDVAAEDVAASDVPAHRLQAPGPLAPRSFQLPEAKTATLSNGLEVLLVENHEVPIVYLNVVVRSGSATDFEGLEGLAMVTLDMMDEGAGSRSAEELSKAARKLGADISTFATTDYAGTGMQVLGRNLEPGLDLLSDVTLRPAFAAQDWELLQQRRVQDLAAAKTDPNRVAARVFSRAMHGDAYSGRLTSEASYMAITPEQMKRWHGTYFRPDDALILVGGDTTLDVIVPLLEARFSQWVAPEEPASRPEMPAEPPVHAPGTVFVHHVPEAAQSVINMGVFVMERDDATAPDFVLANRAFGGQFMSRLNLNLREDKGWTYGARSGLGHSMRPDVWKMSSSVVTPSSVDAIAETFREIEGMSKGGETASGETFGPLGQEELDRVREGMLYTWPLSFENPGYLLQQRLQMWRFDLPEDWLSGNAERLGGVELDAAMSAWTTHIQKDRLVIVVVGDSDVVAPGLSELGLTVIPVDADGVPLGQ
jgi:zinc protease